MTIPPFARLFPHLENGDSNRTNLTVKDLTHLRGFQSLREPYSDCWALTWATQPQGQLGNICGYHTGRAPGIEWVGAGMLLNTLQCPGQSPEDDQPRCQQCAGGGDLVYQQLCAAKQTCCCSLPVAGMVPTHMMPSWPHHCFPTLPGNQTKPNPLHREKAFKCGVTDSRRSWVDSGDLLL